ncbi:MAG: TetR/AcrR family transcriptional regulator [Solirubrobacteraceae bacterium]
MSATARRARYREQRENTRRGILAAADDFLREWPFRELSVDVLMAETDLTRTAFYRHFDDVTDLVLRLLADLADKLYPVAERWRAVAGKEYPRGAQEALSAVVDLFVEDGPLIRAIADAAVTDERIEASYRAVRAGLMDLAAQTLQSLAGQGRLEVASSQALARALTLMNEAYLLEEFGREPFGDRDTALATLERVWLNAVDLRPARP